MSDCRWVTTSSSLSGSWRSFLYSSSVYSCHLFLISSASAKVGSQDTWSNRQEHTISVLYWAHLCMKCSLGISNFLEEISSLSHSVVSLYFFTRIPEEGFLISPCDSLELCIQMGISFLFSLPLASLLFSAICNASSDNYFSFLHFFFLGMVLITASCTMLWTCIHSSSGTLSDLIPWIYFSLPLYDHKGFDLGHTWIVVFPTFFNLSLNLAISSSWSEPQSAPSLIFADCIELLHLWLPRI